MATIVTLVPEVVLENMEAMEKLTYVGALTGEVVIPEVWTPPQLIRRLKALAASGETQKLEVDYYCEPTIVLSEAGLKF